MKTIPFLFAVLFLTGALAQQQNTGQQKISATLDAWHQAAATSRFDSYFGMMTPDAVFIGTDATEN